MKNDIRKQTELSAERNICLELSLIRHGLTASNEAHKYLGRTDEGLSEAGRRRLQADCRRGKFPADILFSGPMRRCRETAELLFGVRECLLIPEWTEIDFGDFEGKSYEELRENPDYQAWLNSGGRLPFPRGESREQFIERTMKGYERLLSLLSGQEAVRAAAGRGGTVRVTAVVHGGTVMALCSTLFGGDYFDYQIPCGGEYQCPIIII